MLGLLTYAFGAHVLDIEIDIKSHQSLPISFCFDACGGSIIYHHRSSWAVVVAVW